MTIHKIEMIALFPLVLGNTEPVRVIETFESPREDPNDLAAEHMKRTGSRLCQIRTWHPDDEPGCVWDLRSLQDGQATHAGTFVDLDALPPHAAESMARTQRGLADVIAKME